MPDSSTIELYKAYSVNVKDFLIAEAEIRRSLNRALKTNKQVSIKVQTKVYALLFCTFSESNFMKMILTPYGFSQQYLMEIISQESVLEKWYKCLELAFKENAKKNKGSDVPNKIQELKKIINKYIVEPSILRNKIAHGQLTISLNRKNTALNLTETQRLENLDFVHIQQWFQINLRLTSIIEDLIESPEKAHHSFYYTKYQELEEFINRTATWSSSTKMNTTSMMKKVKYQKQVH